MNESTAVRRLPWLNADTRTGRWWALVGGVRGLMIGALPILIEVISPNRVAISVAVAVAYLVGALVIARPRAADRQVLTYAFAAAIFVGISLWRMETIDPLNSAQRAYGLAKATYFLEAALPLSLAAALLVSSLNDVRPAVFMFLAVGLVLALLAVVLRDPALLGVSRYPTQGNLIAIAGLLLCQFWLVRDFRIVAVGALLCLVGVVITESRQSLAALVVGLGFTGVYWFLADRVRVRAGKMSALARMWALPAVGYGLVLAAVIVWALLILQPWVHMPRAIRDPVACNCIAGRFVDVFVNPGGRNTLIEQGWNLFAGHPIFGAGLGSYVGLAPYPYPHNIPLEVAGEMGLVGVLILLVPLVVAWIRLTIAGLRAASPAAASLLVIVVVYAVVANLSGDLASERGLWVFGLIALKLGFNARPVVAAKGRA